MSNNYYVIRQRNNGRFARPVSPRIAARKFSERQPVVLASARELHSLGIEVREREALPGLREGPLFSGIRGRYQAAESLCCL